jgi:hypothetical protein
MEQSKTGFFNINGIRIANNATKNATTRCYEQRTIQKRLAADAPEIERSGPCGGWHTYRIPRGFTALHPNQS